MEQTIDRRAPSRRVRLLVGNDFHCALLGGMGFSSKYISSQTGLTVSQIGYRLRLSSIKRSDYRNGESSLSGTVLNQVRGVATPGLKQHLRNVVGKYERSAGQWTQEYRELKPAAKKEGLTLARDNNWLVIQGSHLPQNRAQLLFADSQKKARDLRVCD